MWSLLYKLASPPSFERMAGRLVPWLSVISALLFAYGLIGGLFLAPADYQQGDAFRIIYVHVPCAAMSLAIYVIMAFAGLLYLVWKIKLADRIAKVSAGLGVLFTALALGTGSIWGRPMWGTWWIWDARLSSELILFFLYMGYIALRSAIPDHNQAARATAVLTLVGVVDIPIIHYSVIWWHTLHQGPTIFKLQAPLMAAEMLYPLLAMLAAFMLYYIAVMLQKVRSEIVSL
jgi:heme exporter protein C